MDSSDIIKNRQLVELINYLYDRQVLVKMSIPENDFEFLTIISGIHNMGSAYFFRIDDSEDKNIFQNNISNPNIAIHFEFNGKDRLPYIFKTDCVKTVDNDLWVKFPEQINRIQKRKNFRVAVPEGSTLYLSKDETEYVLSIINLSASGVYARYAIKNRNDKLLDLSKKESVQDLELLLTIPGESDFNAFIKKAIVRRVEIKKELNYIGYAFEFFKINNEYKKDLIRFIYLVQRELLKKRAMMR